MTAPWAVALAARVLVPICLSQREERQHHSRRMPTRNQSRPRGADGAAACWRPRRRWETEDPEQILAVTQPQQTRRTVARARRRAPVRLPPPDTPVCFSSAQHSVFYFALAQCLPHHRGHLYSQAWCDEAQNSTADCDAQPETYGRHATSKRLPMSNAQHEDDDPTAQSYFDPDIAQ